MSIRTILAPISGQYDPDDTGSQDEIVLETAFNVGRTFDAHVEVLCIESQPPPSGNQIAEWLPGLGAAELFEVIEAQSEKRQQRANALFRTMAARFSAPQGGRPGANVGFSARFVERLGELHEYAARRARVHDLVVAGTPPAESGSSISPLLQSLIRESGRPVLIAPRHASLALGGGAAVAWNGTTEASRALAFSLDFLQRAESVTVLNVVEDGMPDPSEGDAVEYLAWHGIRSRAKVLDADGRSAGDVLLAAMEELGAGLLAMGGYTRSSLDRLFYRGATRAVLRRAEVGVLMVD